MRQRGKHAFTNDIERETKCHLDQTHNTFINNYSLDSSIVKERKKNEKNIRKISELAYTALAFTFTTYTYAIYT